MLLQLTLNCNLPRYYFASTFALICFCIKGLQYSLLPTNKRSRNLAKAIRIA